jgi:hypothetical protein
MPVIGRIFKTGYIRYVVMKNACPHSGLGGKSPHIKHVEGNGAHEISPHLFRSEVFEHVLVIVLVVCFYAYVYQPAYPV